MNEVVITGSTGFVGTNLLAYLRSLDIPTRPLNLRTPSSAWDLANTHALVHLAGKAHDLKKVSKPEEYYHVNTVLSSEIFDVFLASKAKVFIMLSSVKAVRDSLDGEILTEDLDPNPFTFYGKSKLAAEEYILSQYVPEGKNVFILRPSMIHGPGNKGNLNLLYNIVQKGFPWPLGEFENSRSYCSIENLCFVIKELIERKDICSGVYNVADDSSLSTNEVIRIIANYNRKNTRIIKINKLLITFMARVGDVLGLPLNSERLHKLTSSYVVSNEKIKNALGKPFPVTSTQGLIRTFKSFSTNA